MSKRLTAALSIFSAALLSACVTTEAASKAAVEDEVFWAIKNGLPVAETIATLGVRGFLCEEDPANAGSFACARKKVDRFPGNQVCLQRVNFKRTPNGTTTGIAVETPECLRP